jgi:RHS repeat-associated protein
MDRLVDQNVSAPMPAGAAVRDVLVKRSWQYDGAGRVRSIRDNHGGATLYDYDSLDQLIQARRGAHREVFDYDAIGSLQGVLKALDDRETATPWGVATGNVLHATKEAEYTNDPNHRRKTKRDRATGAETKYLWDCRDRLREVRLPDGRRALYTYDAFGRRVRKEIVPKQTAVDLASGRVPEVHVVELLWDGDALAAEYDSEHGARVHVHAPGTLLPLLQAEQDEVFVVVCDHLGTPRELVGQDGCLVWAATHSAWGRVVGVDRGRGKAHARPVESPFRLLGQYADEETALCSTRFRYFDAATGRWLSEDPLGFHGGPNLFAFDGAPSVVVDPLGLTCVTDTNGGLGYTIYHIKVGNKVVYVGITEADRFPLRKADHRRKGRLQPGMDMEPVDHASTYGEARGYEQAHIEFNGTRNTSAKGVPYSADPSNRCWSWDPARASDPNDDRAQAFNKAYPGKLDQLWNNVLPT